MIVAHISAIGNHEQECVAKGAIKGDRRIGAPRVRPTKGAWHSGRWSFCTSQLLQKAKAAYGGGQVTVVLGMDANCELTDPDYADARKELQRVLNTMF